MAWKNYGTHASYGTRTTYSCLASLLNTHLIHTTQLLESDKVEKAIKRKSKLPNAFGKPALSFEIPLHRDYGMFSGGVNDPLLIWLAKSSALALASAGTSLLGGA
jgi:hypothetical protein